MQVYLKYKFITISAGCPECRFIISAGLSLVQVCHECRFIFSAGLSLVEVCLELACLTIVFVYH